MGRAEGVGPSDYSPEKVRSSTKGLQSVYNTIPVNNLENIEEVPQERTIRFNWEILFINIQLKL